LPPEVAVSSTVTVLEEPGAMERGRVTDGFSRQGPVKAKLVMLSAVVPTELSFSLALVWVTWLCEVSVSLLVTSRSGNGTSSRFCSCSAGPVTASRTTVSSGDGAESGAHPYKENAAARRARRRTVLVITQPI
jgi:hypothetical protein